MRKQTLFLLLLLLPSCAQAFAQDQQTVPAGSIIESIEVSGLVELKISNENLNIEYSSSSQRRLSQTLRDDLQKLKDQPYDAAVAARFADRIQEELPEYVAAARTSPGTQPGRVRLIFVIAKVSDSDTLGENVNERYPVESVTLEGIGQSEISSGLWDQMQKMVGQPLNNEEAERLRNSIQGELGSRYVVTRKVRRGNQTRQLTVVYEVAKTPILRWESPRTLFAYQSKQGVTIFPHVNFGDRNEEGAVRLGAGTNGDELTERYKGWRFQYEKFNLGTERLAFRVIASTFGAKWKSQTVEAAQQQSPLAPGLYRSRNSVEPGLAFAITPDLYATAGLAITELSMQFPTSHNESVRTGTASLQYQRTLGVGNNRQQIAAGYSVRSGAGSLDSDFVYTRHYWDARYIYRHNSAFMRVDVRAGRSHGNAPLFERFSIGNTETARGWNKYDIAPLGGMRMMHGTLEAGRDDIRLFYDAGSVWDVGQPILVRQSFGLTFGAGERRGEGFLTIAFAVRNSRLEPTVMVRFGGR
jgi:hypothetical protein